MSAILGPWPNATKTAQTLSMIRMGDWWSKGIHLRALCACGAERQVPSAAVLKLFGQEHSWREGFDNERIAKLLVCGTCKQKGRATVRVVQE